MRARVYVTLKPSVFDPQGRHIADFSTIWRLEPDGSWRVVFDRGNDVCAPATGP